MMHDAQERERIQYAVTGSMLWAWRGQDTWIGEGSKEETGCVVRQEGKRRKRVWVDGREKRGQNA